MNLSDLEKELTPGHVAIVVVVASFICFCVVIFSGNKEATEKKLQMQQTVIENILQRQQMIDQTDKLRDSLLLFDLENNNDARAEFLQKIIQKKNENDSRIDNYNSDSLRRAFANL